MNRQQTLATISLSFGRYAGKPLSSVPKGYLLWALTADVPKEDKWIIRKFLEGKPVRNHRRKKVRPQPTSQVRTGERYVKSETNDVPFEEDADPLTEEFLAIVRA